MVQTALFHHLPPFHKEQLFSANAQTEPAIFSIAFFHVAL